MLDLEQVARELELSWLEAPEVEADDELRNLPMPDPDDGVYRAQWTSPMGPIGAIITPAALPPMPLPVDAEAARIEIELAIRRLAAEAIAELYARDIEHGRPAGDPSDPRGDA